MHCTQSRVPAQPAVCLLSLLYATIQPSLLCACSAFYMPQYSRAYHVPTQPSICHNIAEPTVCLLNLLYATIQLSLLPPWSQYTNCIAIQFQQPSQLAIHLSCNTIPSLALQPQSQYTLAHCNTIAQLLNLPIAIQTKATTPPNRLCHNTIPHCIVTQLGSSPTKFLHLFFFVFFLPFFFHYFLPLENT